jgi:hypothetical protein
MTTDCPPSVPIQPSQYNSACPYPAMNYDYVNALPPTRYTSSMGYDHPPHLATVSVFLRSSPPFVDGCFVKGPCRTREPESTSTRRSPYSRYCSRYSDCPWSTSSRTVYSCTSCTCSPSFSLYEHTAFLTAHLTAGGSQRLPPQSPSSSLQHSRAISRKCQHCTFWDVSWRRP